MKSIFKKKIIPDQPKIQAQAPVPAPEPENWGKLLKVNTNKANKL